jgi:hypothetical protein
MWGALSALAMLDAGRAIRTRIATLALYALAGLVALIGLVFALLAAQLQLGEVMAPVSASLTIAAALLTLAGFVVLFARFRMSGRRDGPDIGKAVLATVPFAGAVARKVAPGTAIAVVVLIAAAFLGRKMGRKT